MDEMCGDDPGPKARVRPNRTLRPCLKEPGEVRELPAALSQLHKSLLLAMAGSMCQWQGRPGRRRR